MPNYGLKEFANIVDLSPKSIRRYIEKGQTPDGKQWRKPPKVKGRYVFTDSDLDLWKVDNVQRANLVQSTSGQNEIINRLFDENNRLNRELQEVRALQAKNETALEKDLEKIKESYYQIESEKKHLEERLKNRSLWQRIFNR